MSGLPAAVTIYSISVAIHVIAVVIFLGVTFLFGPLQMAAEKAPNHMPFAIRVVRDAERKMVWPGLAIIATTGIFQVADAGWDQAPGNVWLSTSIVLFVFAALLTFTVVRLAMDMAVEEIERAEAAAADGGEIKLSQDFIQAAGVLSKTGPLMGLIVIVITFLMETKPF